MPGFSISDFVNGPLAQQGQTVTHEVATKTTSNITGDRTLSYAAGVSITAIFLRRKTTHLYDKDGLLETGDSYLMSQIADNVSRNDRITVNGVKFRVERVDRRDPDGSTPMFDFCTLHLLE